MIGLGLALATSVVCSPFESGRMYVHSATVPEYYQFSVGGEGLELKPGPLTRFEVSNQDGKAVPEVKASITARIDRVLLFYEERRAVPLARTPDPQPRFELRKVYAVSATFKSSTYDLDWKDGGDYRYPDKEMSRNLFCWTSEPADAP